MAKASDNPYPSVLVVEGSAPSNPPSGDQRIYIDSADHKLKRVNSSGTVTTIESAGASSPAGKLGYAQITANLTTTSTSYVDATGLSVAVTIGTRAVKVTAYCPLLVNNTTGDGAFFSLFDVTGAVQVQQGKSMLEQAGNGGQSICVVAANLTPAAGSRTYKVQFAAAGGGTATLTAAAATPAFILVEEI